MTSTSIPGGSLLGVRVRAWARSARFPSQLTILLPLILGQLFAERIDPLVFALVIGFGLLDQLFIVWSNDYADRFDDPLNEHPTPFGGGSRVLVEGRLSPETLRTAAGVAAAGMLGISGTLVALTGAIEVFVSALAALGLLWAYSFAPARLSHRGGGELLQMSGVGAVLPLYGYAAQTGGWTGFPVEALAVLLPLELGCALATTRPDEAADRRVRKRTLSVLLGGRGAGSVMVAAHFVALGIFVAQRGELALEVTLVPALFNLGALFTVTARPGTRLMIVHALLGLSVTVSFLGLWIVRLVG